MESGVGLSIEPKGASGRDLVLRLGAGRYDCHLEPDEAVFDRGSRYDTRMYMLDRWVEQVERLRDGGGGTAMSPYAFHDQGTGWLRVTSPDGRTAEVQAGWSETALFAIDPGTFAVGGEGAIVHDFAPIRNARIVRPLDDLLDAVTASRALLAAYGDLER